MKLARARITPYRLPFVQPLETAHGVFAERQGCLLEVETDSGLSGHGDACPFPGFRMEESASVAPSLQVLVAALLGDDLRDLTAARQKARSIRPEAPGARFALDCALYEIAARAEALPVAEILARAWGRQAKVGCQVNALVSGADSESLRRDVESARQNGFGDLKLKLGARPWSDDLDRVRVVREAAGSDLRLRLDVGESWSLEEALIRIDPLAELGVDLIEQPLPAADLAGMVRLRAETGRRGMALAADEAIVRPEDASRVMDEGAADVLVLKPAALGGLGVAAELAEAGREAGFSCVVTSMMDSGWGRTAALSLACALPGARPADGLATGALLASDLVFTEGPTEGRLMRPDGAGFGLESDEGLLAEAACGETVEVWA